MLALWTTGMLRQRGARTALAYSGVALAVALVAIICAFSVVGASSMTTRAVTQVVVDWQVGLTEGADARAVETALSKLPGVTALQRASSADVSALRSSTGGTEQVTGAAKVLGWDGAYLSQFPGQARLLLGSLDGPLLAQQTAANLHVTLGDAVDIARADGSSSQVTVAGIVELPNADALFQKPGTAPGAAPAAPPDNVVILPAAFWRDLFGAGASMGAATQFHVAFDHRALPSSPQDAFVAEGGRARNFEATVAGQALVGDNLAARLDAARADAVYARIVFLFLGLPAAILAILLTVSLLTVDANRKSRAEALLRTRGLGRRDLVRLALVEEALGAAGAAIVGSLIAALVSRLEFGPSGWSAAALLWIGLCGAAGLAIGLLCGTLPTLRRLRTRTISQGRAALGDVAAPLWQRLWVDVLLLGAAAAVFSRSAASNYQVVLAPEGVTATAIDYTAFLSPILFWTGSVLLLIRIAKAAIGRHPAILARIVRRLRLADGIAPSIAANLSRQSGRIAAGIALVALAFSFAFATSIFNRTYDAQSHVDAMLTNGSDVTITGSTDAPAGRLRDRIRALPGVDAAVPMQHRFAYVGSDLQDLYGIDTRTIGSATTIADAYFANHDAAATLQALAATPDGVLVSQETVNDFQLALGDTVKLRLQDATTRQYRTVPFRFVGVALEFPTAPKDSFLVANAAYVAQATRSDAAELLLVKASGDPKAVLAAVRSSLGGDPAFRVSGLEDAYRVIASSLTAVDLGRLTTVEIAFAAVLLIAATGLMLRLGFSERRRTSEILHHLGASPGEIGGFLRSEALLVLVPGALAGIGIGMMASQMLTRLLSGIFDPPPDALSYPVVGLLAFVVVAGLASFEAVRSGR